MVLNISVIYSIKDVLPVLVTEMSYKGLGVQNGDVAIVMFVKMAKDSLSDDELPLLRNLLLSDTVAMVRLLQKLTELSLYY